jgi:hypothetical protein
MSFNFKIGNTLYSNKSTEETTQILRNYAVKLSGDLDHYYDLHLTLFRLIENNFVAPIVDFFSFNYIPSIYIWDIPRQQIYQAKYHLDQGNISLAFDSLKNAARTVYTDAKLLREYQSNVVIGGENIISTLEFVRDGAVMAEGVMAGGLGLAVIPTAAIGAGYGGGVAAIQQVTEQQFNLRDKIDFVGLGSDTILSFFLSLGGGTKYVKFLSTRIANTAIRSGLLKKFGEIPQEAIIKAVTNVLIGRTSDIIKTTILSFIDRARDVQPRMTWDVFLSSLASQLCMSKIFLDMVGSEIDRNLPKK